MYGHEDGFACPMLLKADAIPEASRFPCEVAVSVVAYPAGPVLPNNRTYRPAIGAFPHSRQILHLVRLPWSSRLSNCIPATASKASILLIDSRHSRPICVPSIYEAHRTIAMVSRLLSRSISALQAILNQGNSSAAVEPTVILGGGIIGLSTAYYLALSEVDAHEHSIVVVDPSSSICAGASSQNEGALGQFGFKDEVTPLAKLSYKLHSQLATDLDGGKNFGYSQFNIHAMFSKGYDPSDPRLPYPVTKQEDLSALPSWLTVPESWQVGLVSDGSESAKV